MYQTMQFFMAVTLSLLAVTQVSASNLETVMTALRQATKKSHEQLRDYERTGQASTKIITKGQAQNATTITSLARYKDGKIVENFIDGKSKEINHTKEAEKSQILEIFNDENYSWTLVQASRAEEIHLQCTSKNTELTDYKSGTFYLDAKTLTLSHCDLLPAAISKKMSAPVPGKLAMERLSFQFGIFNNASVIKASNIEFKGNMLFTDYAVVMKTEYDYKVR